MYFDLSMPLTLFMTTVVAMFLNGKVEGKLKVAFEGKEFSVRDAVLTVAAMSVSVSLMVFIPRMGIMIMFLFAYSMLLFMFAYLFSGLQKGKATLFLVAFLIISFVAATLNLFNLGVNGTVVHGTIAFYCLFSFALVALLYEKKRTDVRQRWYLAILPPALFVLLYVFFGTTGIWFPYLLDLYGLTFAILIVLYLGSLFTWNASLIFVGLLTVMDIIMVLLTGTMVSAARHVSPLRLPVLVSLPTIPQIATESGALFISLGLGDFFFAGLLATQTLKKFGRDLALLSAGAMSISFLIFEALMLNYEINAFPGTLMIICGWLPLVLVKGLRKIFPA